MPDAPPTPSGEPILRAGGVRNTYHSAAGEVIALDGVDLRLDAGEFPAPTRRRWPRRYRPSWWPAACRRAPTAPWWSRSCAPTCSSSSSCRGICRSGS